MGLLGHTQVQLDSHVLEMNTLYVAEVEPTAKRVIYTQSDWVACQRRTGEQHKTLLAVLPEQALTFCGAHWSSLRQSRLVDMTSTWYSTSVVSDVSTFDFPRRQVGELQKALQAATTRMLSAETLAGAPTATSQFAATHTSAATQSPSGRVSMQRVGSGLAPGVSPPSGGFHVRWTCGGIY